MADTVRLSVSEALAFCEAAAIRAGASAEVAISLARSVVVAEAEGLRTVGLSHFVDYLESLQAGRMNGRAVPEISRPAGAVIACDAGGGAAHPGFDRAFESLVETARTFGIAVFIQKNAFTAGALGYFPGRLAAQGLVGMAVANGPALLAGSGGTRPVYCTNPLAFAAPVAGGPPLVIDQSSSATAFVNIRKAAAEGLPIPQGWALDAEGRPTTDPKAAMTGALLAFGGGRGANVALMVEVLAAGLSGANWSLDAPDFSGGTRTPGVGLFVLAIQPTLLDPDFSARLSVQLARLSGDYGVHIPGVAKAKSSAAAARDGIDIPTALHQRIASAWN